jgi:hypothetical protein
MKSFLIDIVHTFTVLSRCRACLDSLTMATRLAATAFSRIVILPAFQRIRVSVQNGSAKRSRGVKNRRKRMSFDAILDYSCVSPLKSGKKRIQTRV